MGLEANIHSIRTLEKQIEEGGGDEILVWSLAREVGHSLHSRHFDGLRRGSHNSLLVCRHWFEVASRTLEVWSFWGNTLQDWKKHHTRSGVGSLDLVLDRGRCDPDLLFDGPLQDAVRSPSYEALYDKSTSSPTIATP